MKLVTFDAGEGPRTGALASDGRVIDLSAVGAMADIISGGDQALAACRRLCEAAAGPALRLDQVRLLAPLPNPPRIRDCSLFLNHTEAMTKKFARRMADLQPDPEAAWSAMEARGDTRLNPVFRERIIYYNASHLDLAGPDDDIVCPPISQYIDYELEVACVLGRGGRNIARDAAASHIFGYTIFNDWSMRDVQFEAMKSSLGPTPGKDFANTFGPCIVTRDEIPDVYALEMTARVNGVEWSRGNTAMMFHKFEDAIAELSRVGPVYPGDIIASGTVGTGCAFEHDRKLDDGAVVELEVERIGILRNRVVLERGEQ